MQQNFELESYQIKYIFSIESFTKSIAISLTFQTATQRGFEALT